jgi:Tol biopolymer transport system component
MAGILENRSQLKRRITMIARFKKNSYQWSPLAVILIILLACVSLPDAKRTKASETAAGEPARQLNFRKIWIPTKPGNGVLSPDGERLAFVSEGSVWVIPVHGKVSSDIAGEPVRLTEPMGAWDVMSFLAWSSDGKWIAFNVSDEKEDAIYVVRSSGGVPKKVPVEPRLRNSGYNYRLSLSPDGKVLAFSSRYIEKSEAEPPEESGGLPPSVRGFFIYTVPVAGGEVKRLTDSASGEPAFSPDGKKIAFVKYYTSEKGELCGSLWVVSAAGGTPIQVNDSDPQRQVGGPIWSPDGKMIAFTSRVSQEERRKEICIVSVSETGKASASPTKIELPLTTNDMLAGWTPDNKIGVFLHNPDPWAIYTVPASGGKPVQITTSGWATHPQWSPDGERIYFRWNGGAIASVPSHGGKLSIVRIQRDPPVGLSYPGSGNAVSPDGKEIVFCGGGNIHTVPVGGGEPKKITQGKYPCWSPDGKSIAFIRSHQRPLKRESGWNIYMIPSKGGDVRQLTSEPDNIRRTHIDWSPDGKSIAYFAKNKTIRIIPVQGGEPKIVATAGELKNHDELAWSPDGTKLVYSSKGSIWVVSSDGGEPEEIETGLDAKAGHVSWSPDGKKLAFTAIKGGEEELWLMENFLPEAPVVKPEQTMTVRRIGYEWRGPFASLSPDGRYMSDRDWDTGTLVVREMATGKTRTLVDKDSHEAGFPLVSAISPDSKEVAYLWHDPNTKASSLHVVGLEGTGHRVLCKGKWPMPRDWSSDGKKILAVVLENDVWQKVWISASDGSLEHIASVDKSYPGKLDVSSDGRFIAYDCPQAEDTSKQDIFVLDLSENREVSVVKHPANDKLLGWTPDGKHVFFTSDRTGTWDAWLLQVANGKPQGFPKLARHGIGNITPIGFTPQGSYYYGHEQTLIDVFVARLDLDTGKVLSEPVPVRQTGATACHDWSPDGQYLAYCTQRSDESQAIHIRTLATGREQTLSDNIPYIRWLRWSPDSRSILIDGYKRGDSQGVISKIDVKTGERSDIVRSTTEALVRPEMSPDGKTLFYDRSNNPKSKTVRLIARDLESGREKELFRVVPPARLTNSALSPDGQRIVLSIVPSQTGSEGPVLKTISTAGGQPMELLQFDKSEKLRAVGVTWIPDSQNVLFWKWFRGDRELELWRISAEGGDPRKLWSRKALGHTRVHPDGQRVAFYDRSTTRGIWVMENFLPTAVATSGN